ncbi:predicted protein [Postia placenta Mad-698-R]|nr:predicted protein [Postia placenta Mad-698-R]
MSYRRNPDFARCISNPGLSSPRMANGTLLRPGARALSELQEAEKLLGIKANSYHRLREDTTSDLISPFQHRIIEILTSKAHLVSELQQARADLGCEWGRGTELDGTIAGLRGRNASIATQLENATETLGKEQARRALLEEQVKSLEQSVADRAIELLSLRKDLGAKQARYSELEGQVRIFENAEQQLTKARSALAAESQRAGTLNSKVKELGASLWPCTASRDALLDRLNEAKQEVDVEKQRAIELAAALTSVRAEHESLLEAGSATAAALAKERGALSDALRRLADAEAKEHDLSRRLSAADASRKDLEHELHAKSASLVDAGMAVSSLQQRITELEDAGKVTAIELARTKGAVIVKVSELDTARASLAELRSQHDSLAEDVDRRNRELVNAHEALAVAEGVITSERTEKDVAVNRATEADSLACERLERIEVLTTELDESRAMYADAQEEISRLRSQLVSMQEDRNKTLDQYEHERKNTLALTAEIDDLRNDLERGQQGRNKRSNVKTELELTTAELMDSLCKRCEEFKKDKQALEDHIAELEHTQYTVQRESDGYRKKVIKVAKEKKDIIAEKDKLVKENTKLVKANEGLVAATAKAASANRQLAAERSQLATENKLLIQEKIQLTADNEKLIAVNVELSEAKAMADKHVETLLPKEAALQDCYEDTVTRLQHAKEQNKVLLDQVQALQEQASYEVLEDARRINCVLTEKLSKCKCQRALGDVSNIERKTGVLGDVSKAAGNEGTSLKRWGSWFATCAGEGKRSSDAQLINLSLERLYYVVNHAPLHCRSAQSLDRESAMLRTTKEWSGGGLMYSTVVITADLPYGFLDWVWPPPYLGYALLKLATGLNNIVAAKQLMLVLLLDSVSGNRPNPVAMDVDAIPSTDSRRASCPMSGSLKPAKRARSPASASSFERPSVRYHHFLRRSEAIHKRTAFGGDTSIAIPIARHPGFADDWVAQTGGLRIASPMLPKGQGPPTVALVEDSCTHVKSVLTQGGIATHDVAMIPSIQVQGATPSPTATPASMYGSSDAGHTSRKQRFTMGPRADCEKCRLGVKGHWMHVD